MKDILDNIQVTSPCPANWDEMTGDERARFCGQCQLNVYNISDMTRDEANALIQEKEGRLCVRYYRRSDGTILTKDCPVGLKIKHKRRVSIIRSGVAASVMLVATAGAFVFTAASQAGEGKTLQGDIMLGEAIEAPESNPDTERNESNKDTEEVKDHPPLMGIMAIPPEVEKKHIKGRIKLPLPPKGKESPSK